MFLLSRWKWRRFDIRREKYINWLRDDRKVSSFSTFTFIVPQNFREIYSWIPESNKQEGFSRCGINKEIPRKSASIRKDSQIKRSSTIRLNFGVREQPAAIHSARVMNFHHEEQRLPREGIDVKRPLYATYADMIPFRFQVRDIISPVLSRGTLSFRRKRFLKELVRGTKMVESRGSRDHYDTTLPNEFHLIRPSNWRGAMWCSLVRARVLQLPVAKNSLRYAWKLSV